MTCVKRSFGWFLPVLAIVAAVALLPSTGNAAIVFSGDVSPSNSGDWSSGADGIVGYTAAGTATVDSGSILASENGYVGGYTDSTGGTGTVTIIGANSMWTSNKFYVGYSNASVGIISIENGGVLNTAEGYVGGNPGLSGGTGTVTITGDGSTWTGDFLAIGCANGGNGTLNILNGGSVIPNYDITIGQDSGSAGAVTVDGSGSQLGSAMTSITVGYQGQGQLNIQNGGTGNRRHNHDRPLVRHDQLRPRWRNPEYELAVCHA